MNSNVFKYISHEKQKGHESKEKKMKGRTLIGYQGNNFFYVSATVKYNKNPTSYPRIIDLVHSSDAVSSSN